MQPKAPEHVKCNHPLCLLKYLENDAPSEVKPPSNTTCLRASQRGDCAACVHLLRCLFTHICKTSGHHHTTSALRSPKKNIGRTKLQQQKAQLFIAALNVENPYGLYNRWRKKRLLPTHTHTRTHALTHTHTHTHTHTAVPV